MVVKAKSACQHTFNVSTSTILTVWLLSLEKYKPKVDNAARASEGCILTEGLYFEVRTPKQFVLDLLTGRIYFKLYFYYHSSILYYYIAKLDYGAMQRFTQDKIA